jgi:hypothetical protein
MNNELVRILKGAVVAQFKVLKKAAKKNHEEGQSG